MMLNEDIICTLNDTDINLEIKDLKKYKVRVSARGIVIRNDGKIALQHKVKKNQFKLVGGGIEDNEEPEIAFKREVLEEAGCDVEIIRKLGIIEEYRGFLNLKQISHVFVAKVVNNTYILKLTEKEINEGAKILWLNPREALKAIKKSYDKVLPSKYDNIYDTQFDVVRDIRILEYYNNTRDLNIKY